MGNCPLRPSSLLQWPGEERRKSSKVSNMFQSWKCAILPAALWASVMSTAVDSVSVSITSRPRRLGGNEDFVLPLISCHILHFLLLSAAHEIMKAFCKKDNKDQFDRQHEVCFYLTASAVASSKESKAAKSCLCVFGVDHCGFIHVSSLQKLTGCWEDPDISLWVVWLCWNFEEE